VSTFKVFKGKRNAVCVCNGKIYYLSPLLTKEQMREKYLAHVKVHDEKLFSEPSDVHYGWRKELMRRAQKRVDKWM
jgi:hypothetical protein